MLFPISLEPSVPYQSLSGASGTGKPLPGQRSMTWDACIGLPSLVFLYSHKYPLPFYEPYGKSDRLPLSLFDKDCLMFCKYGILIFIFAENNHTMLMKTPLLHHSFGAHIFLSLFLSISG